MIFVKQKAINQDKCYTLDGNLVSKNESSLFLVIPARLLTGIDWRKLPTRNLLVTTNRILYSVLKNTIIIPIAK